MMEGRIHAAEANLVPPKKVLSISYYYTFNTPSLKALLRNASKLLQNQEFPANAFLQCRLRLGRGSVVESV